MDTMQVSLLVLGLVLIVGVQTGSGIKCYVCNSAYPDNNDDCLQPTTRTFIKECNIYHQDRGLNYTFCRKSVQTVEGDYRVIRACASKARLDTTCIERTGTKLIKMRYCECDHDECNVAPPALSINIVLLTIVSGVIALIFHS